MIERLGAPIPILALTEWSNALYIDRSAIN